MIRRSRRDPRIKTPHKSTPLTSRQQARVAYANNSCRRASQEPLQVPMSSPLDFASIHQGIFNADQVTVRYGSSACNRRQVLWEPPSSMGTPRGTPPLALGQSESIFTSFYKLKQPTTSTTLASGVTLRLWGTDGMVNQRCYRRCPTWLPHG